MEREVYNKITRDVCSITLSKRVKIMNEYGMSVR